MNKKLAPSILMTVLAFVCQTYAYGAITYSNRSVFADAVGAQIIDTYSSATYGYSPGNYVHLNNLAMSAAFGETVYQSDAYVGGINLVGKLGGTSSPGAYCAGCNGSFLLSFIGSSLATTSGVYGVSLDIVYTEGNPPYYAFATFGDGSTQNFNLPRVRASKPAKFWGLTSDSGIASIHFGGVDGAITSSNAFMIDNLTLASSVSAVPEPETYAMMLAGLGLVGAIARRRKIDIV